MEPVRQHLEAFDVAGPVARTTNSAEREPATGRISALWARFFAEGVMSLTPHRDMSDLRNFGVYTRYESDAQGAFDVVAGVAVTQGGVVRIEAGDYLLFTAAGPMPQAVVATWVQVWRYFEDHPEIARRFGTDFEAYTSPLAATVCIGVR